MSDRVLISITDGVADVVFNRADKRNALDNAMFSAIAEAGENLKSESGLRAVVLSGDGASFCAGLDFSSFQAMAGGDGATSNAARSDGNPGEMKDGRITHLGQQVCWVWQELAVPVIAAVHGHALGGGLQIALGADIRIVHPDTKMSVREVYWGLVPDMTGTYMLTQLVRPDVAKELTFTARVFSGVEAAELGLATRLSNTPRGRRDGTGPRDRIAEPRRGARLEGVVQPSGSRRRGRSVRGGTGDHRCPDRDTEPDRGRHGRHGQPASRSTPTSDRASADLGRSAMSFGRDRVARRLIASGGEERDEGLREVDGIVGAAQFAGGVHRELRHADIDGGDAESRRGDRSDGRTTRHVVPRDEDLPRHRRPVRTPAGTRRPWWPTSRSADSS